jgi:hypothetical protein
VSRDHTHEMLTGTEAIIEWLRLLADCWEAGLVAGATFNTDGPDRLHATVRLQDPVE